MTCIVQLNQNDGVLVITSFKLHKLSGASCLQRDIINNTALYIYRALSNNNADRFIDSLNIHLKSLNTSGKNIKITRDINVNITLKPVKPQY